MLIHAKIYQYSCKTNFVFKKLMRPILERIKMLNQDLSRRKPH